MVKIIVLLTWVLLLLSCSKDAQSVDSSSLHESLESRKSNNKITLCHINGKGEFHSISVNMNALHAHLAHGDYIPDADGDGYTAIGACSGSMDDCDDTDPSIHPGSNYCSDCACFDLESVSHSNLLFYYNSENNPCGIYDEGVGVFIFYLEGLDTIVVAGGIEEDDRHLIGRSRVLNGIVIKPTNENCLVYVEDEDITLSQYEACLAGLRAIISSHPTISNVCDLDNPPVLEDTNP